MDEKRKTRIRNAVRFFYDLQKLRIQAGNRNAKQAQRAALDEDDRAYMDKMSRGLNDLEKEGLKEIKGLLKGVPIYEEWLKEQKGIGPTMAGVIVAENNIENCDTASKLWAWNGLAVRDGRADRRVKGQKCSYNPWLKSKMLSVMGGCLIKANSPWRKFYDDYKHRKQHQRVETCMNCEGAGALKRRKCEKCSGKGEFGGGECFECSGKGHHPGGKCKNCDGAGGPAPWGRSDAHRHQAAMRYMVKMFLLELWKAWRELEGLEVRPPYAEEYLDRGHKSGPSEPGQPREVSEPGRHRQPSNQSEPFLVGQPRG